MYQHILIATDGSDLSQKSIEYGLRLSKLKECKVTIITVTKHQTLSDTNDLYGIPIIGFTKEAIQNEQSDDLSDIDDLATQILSRAQACADDVGVAVTTTHETGASVPAVITDAANALGCDLIIMGSHGRTGIKKLILGSQANETLQLSKVPVLVVK